MKLNVFACTGRMTAEVLSPQGKLPVHVNQTAQRAEVSFKAVCEGEALRHALTHAFTRVANQSLTDSPFCHSLTDSLFCTPSLTHYSRLHPCCHSLTDSPFCHFLTDSLFCHSLTYSRLHPFCHSLTDSPLLSLPHRLTPSPVLSLPH